SHLHVERLPDARAKRRFGRLAVRYGDYPTLSLLAQQFFEDESAVAGRTASHVVSAIEQRHWKLAVFHGQLDRCGGVGKVESQLASRGPQHVGKTLSFSLGQYRVVVGHHDYARSHRRDVSPLVSPWNTDGEDLGILLQ